MNDWDPKANEIFLRALEHNSHEAQQAFLNGACSGDAEMRANVESLLQADQQAHSFLERPVGEVAATIDQPIAERPGTQIVPYKLIQEIGEGGMGVVYMAAQKEPVRRKVALKIIKPGMDTREVISRFAAEEQALALMDHPNIARVLDAGSTESGRPYFVMELVNGVPLTQYCDDNNATTAQRLELFVLLCHAVQHAHQKGIIHRDLKPSNILVTLHDGVPVPKIIDFGVAKAINQQLTANTLYTSHGQMIGTPLYMSPEQAEHSGLDIDTRSDIYSLGVVLYELLTGSTPFDREQLKDAGYDEVRRLIREQEPPRPSTRISTLGKAATTASERRRTSPVELSNSLRGELDWIVMKALDKDRTRRYQTANDFARDIQRYLDDEPVEACPPSSAYRLKKFTRRHRTGVLATAAVGLALILGAGVAAGQAYRATRAEKVAEEQAQLANKQKRLAEEAAAREGRLRMEAEDATKKAEAARQRAETVADYLVDVFRSPDPERDGRTVTVMEVMDRLKGQLDTKFSDDLLMKARLLGAIGKTYLGLGLCQEALTPLQQCYGIRRDALGLEDPETLTVLPDLVDAYGMNAGGGTEEAIKIGDEGLKVAQRILGPEHPKTVELMASLMFHHMWDDDTDSAIKYSEETLRLCQKVLGPGHPTTLVTLINMSYAYEMRRGQLENALRLREEALAIARKTLGAEHPQTVSVMVALVEGYHQKRQLADALRLNEEVVRLAPKVWGPEHPDTLYMATRLGTQYVARGRIAKGLELLDKTWPLTQKSANPQNANATKFRNWTASAFLTAGQFDRAMSLLETPLASLPHESTVLTRAMAHLHMGSYDKAIELFTEALRAHADYPSDPKDPETLDIMHALAFTYAMAGRHNEAIQLSRDTLDRIRGVLGKDHPDTALYGMDHGAVLCKAQQYSEAVPLLESATSAVKTQLGPESPRTLTAMCRLAVAYHGVGRLEEAMKLHAETLQLQQKVLGPEHPQTLASMILLGSGYIEQARYADAEPLLLAAQEGYAKRDAAFPTPYDHSQARDACTQLVRLYEQSNQPEKATAWKERLDHK